MHFPAVPRSGPRNIRVFGETTNSLSVNWEHADGPVQQYRIIYSPTVGDPIDEYVSFYSFTRFDFLIFMLVISKTNRSILSLMSS